MLQGEKDTSLLEVVGCMIYCALALQVEDDIGQQELVKVQPELHYWCNERYSAHANQLRKVTTYVVNGAKVVPNLVTNQTPFGSRGTGHARSRHGRTALRRGIRLTQGTKPGYAYLRILTMSHKLDASKETHHGMIAYSRTCLSGQRIKAELARCRVVKFSRTATLTVIK